MFIEIYLLGVCRIWLKLLFKIEMLIEDWIYVMCIEIFIYLLFIYNIDFVVNFGVLLVFCKGVRLKIWLFWFW